MLDATYFGLTSSDWRMLAVVVGIFGAIGIVSAIGEHRPRRSARTTRKPAEPQR